MRVSKPAIKRLVARELAKADLSTLQPFLERYCAALGRKVLFVVVLLDFKEFCKDNHLPFHEVDLCRLLERAGYVRSGVFVRDIAAVKDYDYPADSWPWWLPAEIVSGVTGIKIWDLAAMRERGVGPPWRMFGHSVFYGSEALHKWMAEAVSGDKACEDFLLRRCVASCFKVLRYEDRTWHGRPALRLFHAGSVQWSEIQGAAENWFCSVMGCVPKNLGVRLRRYLISLGCRERRRRSRTSDGTVRRPRAWCGLILRTSQK